MSLNRDSSRPVAHADDARRTLPGRPPLSVAAGNIRRAEQLGVGFSTVCRWFREDGVPLHVPTAVRHNLGKDYHGCISIMVSIGAGLYRRVAGAWEGIAMMAAQVSSLSVSQSPVV